MRSRIIYLFLAFLLLLGACKPKDWDLKQNILPYRFKVTVPDAISTDKVPTQKLAGDSVILDGALIYNYMRYFIHTGEAAADVANGVMDILRKYEITPDMTLSFTGDDGHVKNVVVKSNVYYQGVEWKYGLTITDAQADQAGGDAIAMQLFWNLNPTSGVAVLKPSLVNTDARLIWGDAMVRIDYSENIYGGYDAQMTVSIAGMPVSDNNKFAIQNMKMTVGNISGRVDVYATSLHPNLWLLLPDKKGYACAFVASASNAEDIAVAQVGMPPDTLDSDQRQVLLFDYSLYNVLFDEIDRWYAANNDGAHLDTLTIDSYISAAKAPAYFGQGGFIASSFMPGAMYEPFVEALDLLTPYNPREVGDLAIAFEPFPDSK